MKGLQQTVFKLLAVLILIGAMAGAWISWQRYHVEAAAQTVEMVYAISLIVQLSSEPPQMRFLSCIGKTG